MTGPFFAAGESVVVRYITRMDGLVGMTWPYRVVRDDDDVVALWIPRGTTGMLWRTLPGEPRELVEAPWRRDTLRLMFPGKQYSVWLFWEGDHPAFTTYYVNFEEPFRRTPVGFDTNDHALDIVVAPDRSWAWKDRDEFEQLIATGHFSREFADSVESAAASVLELIAASAAPFDGSWLNWTAPEVWPLPELGGAWRTEMPTLWPKRGWAYPLANRAG